MSLVIDGRVRVHKVAGMGPYDNNGYVIADSQTREAYLVDAPAQINRLLDEASDYRVQGVLVTHTHPDHVAGYADLKRLSDLPVAVHDADAGKLPGKPESLLTHGQRLRVGAIHIRVMHTPGHTPGGLCLVLDDAVITGDTLFPGGPGRTITPANFQQVVASITTHLLPLDGQTLVLPGHGADTTIGNSRREYAAFARRHHPDDLHDHVSWLTS